MKWDDKVPFISNSVRNGLNSLGMLLCNNTPVPISSPTPPAVDNTAYDGVIMVDSSGEGVGALVELPHEVWEFKKKWAAAMPHSAVAEPLGVSTVVEAARFRWPSLRRLAIITDHKALVMGQQRWYNAFGGFGWSPAVNNVYRLGQCTFFFVAGAVNLADCVSRSTSHLATTKESWTLSDVRLPHLCTYEHPYAEKPPRNNWMV